jgi:hypothetical protein
MLCVIILFCSGHAAARSASEESVCLGGELTLNCSTNETVLEWEIVIPHRAPDTRHITTGPATIRVDPLNVTNVAKFHFMRISISPLVSMIRIDNVSIGLNGTRVECSAGGGDHEVIEATIPNVIENGMIVHA